MLAALTVHRLAVFDELVRVVPASVVQHNPGEGLGIGGRRAAILRIRVDSVLDVEAIDHEPAGLLAARGDLGDRGDV